MLHQVYGYPQHTYLKLKMDDLHGIITASASFKAAYNCELATLFTATKKLA